MSAVPYRDEHGAVLPPAREAREEDRIPLSTAFDNLIASNLALTTNVGKLTGDVGRLVHLTYGVIAFNFVLVAIVVFVLWRQ